MIVFTVKVR